VDAIPAPKINLNQNAFSAKTQHDLRVSRVIRNDVRRAEVEEVILMQAIKDLYRHDVTAALDRFKVSSRERAIVINLYTQDPNYMRSNEETLKEFYYGVAKGYDIPVATYIALSRLQGFIPFGSKSNYDLFDESGNIIYYDDNVPFDVSGRDLIALGMKPGPKMGKLVEFLRDQWYQNGCVEHKDQLLSRLTDTFADLNQIEILQMKTTYDQTTDVTDKYVSTSETMVTLIFDSIRTVKITMLFKDSDTAMLFKLSDPAFVGTRV
jgi:hypothetical protein